MSELMLSCEVKNVLYIMIYNIVGIEFKDIVQVFGVFYKIVFNYVNLNMDQYLLIVKVIELMMIFICNLVLVKVWVYKLGLMCVLVN